MKALVLDGPGASFSLETVPDPSPEPGEAVAKVITCGAGLTIQHVKAGRAHVDYPRIIGHEITGVIQAVGHGVSDIAVGDPVTAYFYLTCGRCKWCRLDRETLCENFGGYIGRACDGGYAELMRLPAHNFLKLPDELGWKSHPAEAGVITDAIATPLKVVRHANIQAGETVAVFGGGGDDKEKGREGESEEKSSGSTLSKTQQEALQVLAKYESGAAGYDAVNQIGTKGGRGVEGFSGDIKKMPQHKGRSLTDFTELIKFSFSLEFSLISTIFSTPLFPIITGTPAYTF